MAGRKAAVAAKQNHRTPVVSDEELHEQEQHWVVAAMSVGKRTFVCRLIYAGEDGEEATAAMKGHKGAFRSGCGVFHIANLLLPRGGGMRIQHVDYIARYPLVPRKIIQWLEDHIASGEEGVSDLEGLSLADMFSFKAQQEAD
jgi:hypothetical protein